MIKVENLGYKYPGLINCFEIKNVSFELREGYITLLVGKNGSGKTTLMKNLYGILSKNSGKIIYKDKEITYENMSDYHRDVAYIDENIFYDKYTVRENAEVFGKLYKSFEFGVFEEMMKKYNINCLDKYYKVLSKGERMKAVICFVLSRKPKYVIMDEPFANLDIVVKREITEFIMEMIGKDETGFFISTHLIDEIEDFVDYVMVIENGEIKLNGDREKFFKENNDISLSDALIAEISE